MLESNSSALPFGYATMNWIEEWGLHPFERWQDLDARSVTCGLISITLIYCYLFFADQASNHLHRFFMHCAFKGFSFRSILTGLEPAPFDYCANVLPTYTKHLTSAAPHRPLYIRPLMWLVHAAHAAWLFIHYSTQFLFASQFIKPEKLQTGLFMYQACRI